MKHKDGIKFIAIGLLVGILLSSFTFGVMLKKSNDKLDKRLGTTFLLGGLLENLVSYAEVALKINEDTGVAKIGLHEVLNRIELRSDKLLEELKYCGVSDEIYSGLKGMVDKMKEAKDTEIDEAFIKEYELVSQTFLDIAKPEIEKMSVTHSLLYPE